MSEIARMWATIGADTSGLESGLAKSKSALSSFGEGFQQLQDIGKRAVEVVTAAIVAAGTAVAITGIQFDALKEQATVAFTTMLGSGQAAQNMLNELQAFAQRTPFEFPDLIRASQRLMAMGFQAQQVIPQLTAIGDAVAAMGGGAEMVDRVTLAIGQMSAKGVVSAEEMRQLTEAGIPAWQILADKIGITVPEAMKQVQAGAVESSVAIAALNAGIEERFGGMMDKQSQTWNGIISNIKDGFTQLSGTIMAPFFDMAKEGLVRVQNALQQMQIALQHGYSLWNAFGVAMANLLPVGSGLWDAWVNLSNAFEKTHDVIALLLPPLTTAIGKFISWRDIFTALGIIVVSVLGSIVASFAPVIATVAALAAGVATLRWAWQSGFGGIRTFTLGVFSKITDFMHSTFGSWVDSWQSLGDHLNFIIFYMWSNYVYFPIRSFLIKTRDDLALHIRLTIKWWQDWATNTRDTIANWVTRAKDKFWEFIGIMSDWYHGWADPIWTKLKGWWSAFVDWFHGWADPLYNTYLKPWVDRVLALFKPLADWWKDHIDPWIQYGRDLIQGLWDGIRAKWNDLSSWFSGVWSSLVYKFKSFFGIASPSTVFADIGSDMMLGLAQGIDGSQQFVVDAMGNIVEATKKYTEWDKLGDALGQSKAMALAKNIQATGMNALSDIKRAGIGSDSNVYAWAMQLAQASSSDTIGNLQNTLNNVIQQFDQLGLSNSYGKGTRETLGSLSGTLGDFLDTGTYYAPYVSGSGSSATVGGTTADTNKFMQAISVALNKILAELQKDGKMEEAGLNKIVVAINNLDSGLGGKVAVTTGLR